MRGKHASGAPGYDGPSACAKLVDVRSVKDMDRRLSSDAASFGWEASRRGMDRGKLSLRTDVSELVPSENR